ncbi:MULTISPECIES: hypothetical protein [Delftia]|jgi:hypothetical protein|uniref:hypothetical protein n=1 Tax=Delftia TaxID=80865 RepID=UPI001178A983|nr:hypothetical protein [Delftia sp. 60]
MKKSFFAAVGLVAALGAASNAFAAGNLEQAHICVVSGWACDEADPSYTGSVLVYHSDGRLIRKLTANHYREPGVGAACGGNSYRGFAGELDTTPGQDFSDGYHNVRVYFERRNGSLLEIGGSPRVVLFGPAQLSPGPNECANPRGWGN